MLVVTGAAGNVGSEVVRALTDARQDVRAVVRKPDAASFTDDVEVVAGDLNDPSSFSAAFDGVSGVFVLAGYATAELVGLAEATGVRCLVLLSAGSVRPELRDNAMVRFNLESEETVQRSSLAWSILRPSGFMSNALRWLPQLNLGDVIVAPFGGVPVASIDPADIGSVAAAALLDAAHAGATYRLTGPAPMVPGEQVAVLARVLGRPLTFRGQPDEKAYAEMVASMPIDYADALRSFFVDGTYNDAHVLPTVRDVLGRAPRTFEQWAAANADRFR